MFWEMTYVYVWGIVFLHTLEYAFLSFGFAVVVTISTFITNAKPWIE